MINKVNTPEQKAALIEFNRAIIAQYESYAVPEAGWPDEARLMLSSARIALASLTAEPVEYRVLREDGGIAGHCATLEDAQATVKNWNENWKIQPVYTAPPAPALRLPEAIPEQVRDQIIDICDGVEVDDVVVQEVWAACVVEVNHLNATAPQPLKLPDDGLDDCIRDWGIEQARNDFDTGYNYASWRYQQELEKAGYQVEGE
ncbi:hypothetical protein [Bacillus altitudinis]|uniref:hypothetical protein n=1 Tax=Bacillus altitudinis TaxID=293387 RepID=UPI00366C765D